MPYFVAHTCMDVEYSGSFFLKELSTLCYQLFKTFLFVIIFFQFFQNYFIRSVLFYLDAKSKILSGLMDIYTSLPDSNLEKVALGLHRNDFMYQTLDPTKENAFLNGHFKLVRDSFY